MNLFISIKALPAPLGSNPMMQLVSWLSCLLRKPLDIILPWQGDLIWSYSDVSGWISWWRRLGGLDWLASSEVQIIVVSSGCVCICSWHMPSSLGSVGGSGGLTERISVHLQERKLHVHWRCTIIKRLVIISRPQFTVSPSDWTAGIWLMPCDYAQVDFLLTTRDIKHSALICSDCTGN